MLLCRRVCNVPVVPQVSIFVLYIDGCANYIASLYRIGVGALQEEELGRDELKQLIYSARIYSLLPLRLYLSLSSSLLSPASRSFSEELLNSCSFNTLCKLF